MVHPTPSPEQHSWQTLHISRYGPVLHITLNRPEVRNAMTLVMVDELLQVLAAAEQNGSLRVLVLRGAGGHFCAGGDLKDMAAARASDPGHEAAPENPNPIVTPSPVFNSATRSAHRGSAQADPLASVNARFGELCVAYANTGLATVAVLEGTVMGGGFGLACVVDVALAASNVLFRLPETSLGLLPAQIAPFLMQRLGVSQARRLAVTGGRLDAAQALVLGLVHEVCETAALEAALQRVLGDILQCAPQAIAATKQLMNQGCLQAPATMVAPAAAAFARAARGPEGAEGLAAFAAKRQPSWAVQP